VRDGVRLRSGGLGGGSRSLGLLLVSQASGFVVDGGNLLLDLDGDTSDLLARGGLKSLIREREKKIERFALATFAEKPHGHRKERGMREKTRCDNLVVFKKEPIIIRVHVPGCCSRCPVRQRR
jgi:hypothetical protein